MYQGISQNHVQTLHPHVCLYWYQLFTNNCLVNIYKCLMKSDFAQTSDGKLSWTYTVYVCFCVLSSWSSECYFLMLVVGCCSRDKKGQCVSGQREAQGDSGAVSCSCCRIRRGLTWSSSFALMRCGIGYTVLPWRLNQISSARRLPSSKPCRNIYYPR